MFYDEQKFALALFYRSNTKIFEYEISSENFLSHEDSSFLINRFKADANNCLISGNTIYLQRSLGYKTMTIPVPKNPGMTSEIKLTYRCELPLKAAIRFFKALFNKITDHLNDFGDPQEIENLNESNIFHQQKFQGLWTSDVVNIGIYRGGGLSIKLDVNQKFVCQRSVYEYIQEDLGQNPDKKVALMKSLIGKTVLTHYNNKSYVIHEVDFESSPLERFQDDDQMLSFAAYYKKRYNIDTRHFEQPMLINRVTYQEPSSGSVANYVHCLIPEFCYPVHTEWAPVKNSSQAFVDFLGCLRSYPKAREILGEWGLSFEKPSIPDTFRRIPLFDVNSSRARPESAKKMS